MIDPEDARKLTIGHSAGNLTSAEKAALYRAAFDDQDVFDRLMEEEAVRQALEIPGNRARLLEAIGERRESWLARAFDWMRQPAVLGLAGSLAAALMVGVFLTQQKHPAVEDVPAFTEKSVPMAAATESEAALAAGAFALPLQNNIETKLFIERPEYRPGEAIQINFETGEDASVLVFEAGPNQNATLLYPAGDVEAVVPAGERIRIPAGTGSNLVAEGPMGIHRVRLVALPPGSNPLKTPPDWKQLDGRVGVREIQYRVVN